MPPSSLKGLGFFSPSTERVFAFLQWLSGKVIPIPQSFTARWAVATEDQQLAATRRRAWQIDLYIAIWLTIEAALVASVAYSSLGRTLSVLIAVGAVIRIVDIVQVGVNMSVFNHLRLSPYYISSIARTVVLTFINYFELMVCFGLLYALRIECLASTVNERLTWPDAFYFSAITQLTVGYGDIRPSGVLKIAACIQAALGVLFALLIVSRFVAMLPSELTVVNGASAGPPTSPAPPNRPAA